MACGTLADIRQIDPTDRRPPYQQVAESLRQVIRTGELKQGAQLPALQALSETYGVSIGTVKSAVAVLRDDGLVTTQHGRGSFVRTDVPTPLAAGGGQQEVRRLVGELTARRDAVERRLSDR